MYAAWAPTYEARMGRALRRNFGFEYPEGLEHLARLAGPVPGERVLDVATGTGALARYLADRLGADGQVIGLDLSSAMLREARHHLGVHGGRPILLEVGAAEKLPHGPERFDCVTCGLSFQYFDAERALLEIRRVLRPGGRLVILVDAARPWQRTPWVRGVRRVIVSGLAVSAAYAGERWASFYTNREWQGLLEGCGFGAVRIISLAGPRRVWSGLLIALVARKV